ncbi:hypothetical protein K439DRAFT_1611954 [Ramaria rubella]|nr:hypothetical protein K439DRAFT_1611954 [Ramaria rubella]
MHNEPHSPSPAVSVISTPLRSQTISATSPYSPSSTCPEIDEAALLHVETFAPCREHIRNTQMMLTWTHDGEQVWPWLAYPSGQLYVAHELPQVFERLYLTPPQCPCAMQETDPNRNHNYNIWVVQKPGVHMGKIAAACTLKGEGCTLWLCLNDLLENFPDMPSQAFKERPSNDLGVDIPGFNRCGLLREPSQNTPGTLGCQFLMKDTPVGGCTSTSSNVLAIPETPPPPYCGIGKSRRCELGGVAKSGGRGSGIKKHVQLVKAGLDNPFVIQGSKSVSSTSSQFTIPELPLPTTSASSSTFPNTTMAPTVLASSKLPLSNQLALEQCTFDNIDKFSSPPDAILHSDKSSDTGSNHTTPHSLQNMVENVTMMPGE